MPIFLVLGTCAAVLFYVSGEPMVGVAQVIIDQLNSSTLMALPLFVMAATFMRQGGVARALVNLTVAWLGGIRGSLGLVTVVACTLFAAICGSSVATALAMGTILLPEMLAKGYPRPFALGVIGASGTIGIVIPPSLALILYGIVAEQSVPRLFLAGILPGLLQATVFFAWVWWYGHRYNLPKEDWMPWSERLRVSLQADTGAHRAGGGAGGNLRWPDDGDRGGRGGGVRRAARQPVFLPRLSLDADAGRGRGLVEERGHDHADRGDRAGAGALDDGIRRYRRGWFSSRWIIICAPGSFCSPSTCCCWCWAASWR